MNNFLKKIWILSIILIISLLTFYIFQMSALVSEIYSIKNYEKELTEILQKNRALEITYSQKNSFENIENLIKELNFKRPTKTSFIQILRDSIVVK